MAPAPTERQSLAQFPKFNCTDVKLIERKGVPRKKYSVTLK